MGNVRRIVMPRMAVGLLAGLLVLAGCAQLSAPAGTQATSVPAAPAGAPTAGQAEKPIERQFKFAYMASLTGPAADSTEPSSLGTIEGFNYINEQGGLPFKNPKTGKNEVLKFDFTYDDIAYQAPLGLAAYKKYLDSGVQMVASGANSVADAIAKNIAADRMPFSIQIWTDSLLQAMPRWFIASNSSFADQLGAGMDFIAKQKPGANIAVIAADNSQGRSLAVPATKDYAQKLGLKWVAEEWIPGTQTDFTIELKRVSAQKPDWIFVQLPSGQSAAVLKDADRLGILNSNKWMMSNYVSANKMKELAGNLSAGVYGVNPNPELTPSTAQNKAINIVAKVFKDKRNRAYDAGFGFGFLHVTIPNAEGIRVAAEKYGWPLTGEQVLWGLNNINNFNWNDAYPVPLSTSPKSPTLTPFVRMWQIGSDLTPDFVWSGKAPALSVVPVADKQPWETP